MRRHFTSCAPGMEDVLSNTHLLETECSEHLAAERLRLAIGCFLLIVEINSLYSKRVNSLVVRLVLFLI